MTKLRLTKTDHAQASRLAREWAVAFDANTNASRGVARRILKAILAERTRAIQIAEHHGIPTYNGSDEDQGRIATAKGIAEDIAEGANYGP